MRSSLKLSSPVLSTPTSHVSVTMQAFTSPYVLRVSSLQPRNVARCKVHQRKLHTVYRTSTRATLTTDPEASSSTTSSPTTESISTSNPTSNTTDNVLNLISIDDLSLDRQELVTNLQQQLEFWFSTSNIRRDWFLRSKMTDEGWLDISTFESFNRVKSLGATFEDLKIAANSSSQLEISSTSDTQVLVRRAPNSPGAEEQYESELARSVILKRLPSDVTIEFIQDILSPLADPLYIRIYRSKDFPDIPRALACFKDEETANDIFQRFSAEAPAHAHGIVMRKRPSESSQAPMEVIAGRKGVAARRYPTIVLKVVDFPINIQWKRLYQELKDALQESYQIQLRYLLYNPGDQFCNLTFLSNPSNTEASGEIVKSGLMLSSGPVIVSRIENQQDLKEYWERASNNYERRKAKQEEMHSNDRFYQGVIVRIEGIPKQTPWLEVRDSLRTVGRLLFLSYNVGDESCYGRFKSGVNATIASEKINTEDFKIAGKSVKANVIEGEEEEMYWSSVNEQRERINEGSTKSQNVDQNNTTSH